MVALIYAKGLHLGAVKPVLKDILNIILEKIIF